MLPVLKEIKMKCPNIDTAHFFSDGPCSQYRQKHNFYLFTKHCHDLGFTSATWNFFEAGHGKGAPDGIGSSVKQAADRQVKYGQDISCSYDFIYVLNKANTSIKMYEINKSDIEKIDTAIPQKLKPVAGTMKLHQVIMEQDLNTVSYRDISCFCRYGCEHAEHNLRQHIFKKPTQQLQDRSVTQSVRKNISSPHAEVEDCQPTGADIPCVKHFSNSLDPLMALKRLAKCHSFGLLHHECEALNPYIRLIQGQRRSLSSDKLMVDTFASGFTPKDLITSQTMFAAKVRMDGDCLPGCGSVFAFGKDDHSDLLRLLIIHELALHADFYTKEENLMKGYQKETSGSNELVHAYDKFIPGVKFNVRKIFEEETLGLLKPKSFMGIWQIFALSSVLRTQITSVYPQLGNPLVRRHLHRMIMPRVKSTSHIAFIMWTSTRSKSPYNWLPNHFVPLLPFR